MVPRRLCCAKHHSLLGADALLVPAATLVGDGLIGLARNPQDGRRAARRALDRIYPCRWRVIVRQAMARACIEDVSVCRTCDAWPLQLARIRLAQIFDVALL